MKTERELLELAAKATGKTELTWCEAWKCMALHLNIVDGFDRDTCWHPLRNDGDALRLAVAIGELDLLFLLSVHGDASLYITDPAAAIRLAITKAAAAIQVAKEAP